MIKEIVYGLWCRICNKETLHNANWQCLECLKKETEKKEHPEVTNDTVDTKQNLRTSRL
jgi:hypothetical protein